MTVLQVLAIRGTEGGGGGGGWQDGFQGGEKYFKWGSKMCKIVLRQW